MGPDSQLVERALAQEVGKGTEMGKGRKRGQA